MFISTTGRAFKAAKPMSDSSSDRGSVELDNLAEAVSLENGRSDNHPEEEMELLSERPVESQEVRCFLLTYNHMYISLLYIKVNFVSVPGLLNKIKRNKSKLPLLSNVYSCLSTRFHIEVQYPFPKLRATFTSIFVIKQLCTKL